MMTVSNQNEELDAPTVTTNPKDTHIKSEFDTFEKTFEIEKCAKWILDCQLGKVCLQFPDSLMPDSPDVASRLENRLSKKVFILGDNSCTNCCIDEVTARHVNGDGIIHFGHACLSPMTSLPAFHVLPQSDIDTKAFCEKFTEYFIDKTKKILFFYDVAYGHAIELIYKNLKSTFKNLSVTTLNCTSNVDFVNTKTSANTLPLGRNCILENGYKIEDYDAFFLGPNCRTLNVLGTSVPVKTWYYWENDTINELIAVNTPWLKRRRYLVEKLKDAGIVGIVIATLGIKGYLDVITIIKSILKQMKKKSYIISVGKPNPAKLANFSEVDAFVVITCPENDIFTSRDFHKPILMPYEVDLAFNAARTFSQRYYMDFREILPGEANYVSFEASSNSDVSLISGGIRDFKENPTETPEMNALTTRLAGIVAISNDGANYLLNRSWQGLEQRLGQDKAKPAEKGRSGLPASYENEPMPRRTED
ncbi:2-(3-amino-3-carboxypropyl)histidine synthase subunit 2 [Orussus abietinus]|uniref:2-(3-amino-3-carboxypropyl)histidine synthase subunit 2 n=1 Tax=Orussus abietinus TaxID=222816 RepID=UPI0006269445|nr:2-(3-amino-3-carboxypropyl)histidine synthase subunit 2 [Orussus abietinus]